MGACHYQMGRHDGMNNLNTAMSKVSGGKLYNKQGNYRGIELWQH